MIDAHCHIDLYPDPSAEVARIEHSNDAVIGVTNLPSHFEEGREHVKGLRRIRLCLGMHPLMVDRHAAEMPIFDRLVQTTRFIGEVGLDFSQQVQSKDAQVESFRHVLRSIAGRRRFVSIHSRRAERTVLELLLEFQIETAVFHWFTGSQRDLLAIAEAGYYFSVNPAMVGTERSRRLVSLMPPHLVLTETDGPFVKLGGRPVRPAEVDTVICCLSEIWRLDKPTVHNRLKESFARALPPKHNSGSSVL